MKRILLYLLIFVGWSLYGQSEDTLPSKKYDLGFTFSPDLSYRKIKAKGDDAWMTSAYDTMEVYKYGYTVGLNFIYHLSHKWELSTGLYFSDKGEKTKDYIVQPVNNYTNHFYYLDLPFRAIYFFKDKKDFYSKPKKIKFYLTLGTSINFFLFSKISTQSGSQGETEKIKVNPEVSRVNLAFIAGLGMDIPITQRWFFKVEPNYRRSVSKIANAPIKKYLYSFGLNFGFFYRF